MYSFWSFPMLFCLSFEHSSKSMKIVKKFFLTWIHAVIWSNQLPVWNEHKMIYKWNTTKSTVFIGFSGDAQMISLFVVFCFMFKICPYSCPQSMSVLIKQASILYLSHLNKLRHLIVSSISILSSFQYINYYTCSFLHNLNLLLLLLYLSLFLSECLNICLFHFILFFF